MEVEHSTEALVLVIGAGPAGLFAAQELAAKGVQVILLNRDIKPGGLAEYGIYYSKHRIKDVLRAQFQKILDVPQISYCGNVTIGEHADVTLAQLRGMGFDAIVVAVGAQGTKWLRLPGEHLRGVYHAKDVIYHYNGLPPFSEQHFDIGKRVALIGVGNVMADVAQWLVCDLKVDEVVAVARRGPAEVKFSPRELACVAANLDLAVLDQEFVRVRARMEAVGQDPVAAKRFIVDVLQQAEEPISDTRMRFRFLSSPIRIQGDDTGRASGLEVEDTELTLTADGETKARGLGTTQVLDVDTVIFCIGDRVSEDFGLPVQSFSFVKNPAPRYPVDGISFEAYDPAAGAALDGVFLVGWARLASKGQVALARKDARGCVKSVLSYLAQHPSSLDPDAARRALFDKLARLGKPIVDKEDALRLAEIEAAEAERRGEPNYKFTANEAMLEALELG